MEKKDKIVYLEVLRVLCTLAVLFNHVPLAAIHLFDSSATVWDKALVTGTVNLVHFAVPVFVMITGYLLLQPTREIDFKKAVEKYAWRMCVILFTVGTAFAWMELFFADKHFSLGQISQAVVNMLEGHSWKHLWYLYMLVGLYMVTPVLKAMVKVMSVRNIDRFIGIGLFFTSVCPMVELYADFKLGFKFPMSSVYLFYMLLGYRIGSLRLDEAIRRRLCRWAWTVVIVMAVGYMATGYLRHVLEMEDIAKLGDYTSLPMVFYSAMLFVAVMTTRNKYSWFNRIGGGVLSRDSFGIYVFHMLWVNIIYKVVKFNPVEEGVWTLIPTLIVVLLLTWGTTIAYRKLPLIGKYI